MIFYNSPPGGAGNFVKNKAMKQLQTTTGLVLSLVLATGSASAQQSAPSAQTKTTTNSMHTTPAAQSAAVRFIDHFHVPAAAKSDFLNRVRINRAFIKTLPGFMGDEMYGHTNDKGDFTCITIAGWENAEALKAAKSAVQQAYEKEGFDPAAFMRQLGITMERGIFEKMEY